MNCERGTWRCPVCNSNAQLEGLEVDHYIWGIISGVNQRDLDVDEVMVDAAAEWKPVEKPPDVKDEDVDSPPLKKPKMEPSTSPPKNPRSDTPTSHSNTTSNPCYSSNGLPNTSSDTPPSVNSNLPPPSSLPPSSALAQKSQVSSQGHSIMQNSISNHIAPQVSISSTASVNKSANSRGTVSNHRQVIHYNAGPVPNSSGLVSNSMGQLLQTDGQQQPQHSNNDSLFEGLEDADDLNLLTYLNDELPSQLLSSMLDP